MSKIVVPPSIATLERLKYLAVELDMMQAGRKPSQRDVSADFLLLLQENAIDKVTRDVLVALRAGVAAALKGRQIVRITTALPLEARGEQAVAKWFRAQIGGKALVSFRTDAQILGGVIIQTPAHRYDFSLLSGLADGRAKLVEMVSV